MSVVHHRWRRCFCRVAVFFMRSAFPGSIWLCFWCWRRSYCGPSVSVSARRMPQPALACLLGLGAVRGGLVPLLIFGVAFGNVIVGVPFHYEADLRRSIYEGGLFGLLNPFALLCGLVSVAMLVMHGSTWLTTKTSAPLPSARAITAAWLRLFWSRCLRRAASGWLWY